MSVGIATEGGEMLRDENLGLWISGPQFTLERAKQIWLCNGYVVVTRSDACPQAGSVAHLDSIRDAARVQPERGPAVVVPSAEAVVDGSCLADGNRRWIPICGSTHAVISEELRVSW